MKAAHDYLWPDFAYTWNDWDEQRFRAHCGGWKYIVLAGGASCAKAQPYDALVLTPDGYKMMGDIRVGDAVSTPDGKSCQVVATQERGVRPCYKVFFSDGTSTICADDHLWTVRSSKKPWIEKTLSTKELSKLSSRWFLPPHKPVIGHWQNLEVDPYLLGIILGNGSISRTQETPTVCVNEKDVDVIRELLRLWPKAKLYKTSKTGAVIIGFPQLKKVLVKLGIFGCRSWEKFIPQQCLNMAVEQRRRLLQGLLDSDGTISKTGAMSFCSTSKRLVSDISFLVRSLGGYCGSASSSPSSYKKNGKDVRVKDSYRIRISQIDNPFFSERKASRVKDRRSLNKAITKITLVEPRPVKCISLGTPEGLYFTNDFIVTHNSHCCARIANIFWLSDPRHNACVIASVTLESLETRIWGYAAKFMNEAAIPVEASILRSKPPKIMPPGAVDKIHGMFAVAIRQGDPDTVLSTIIGRHPNKRLMIVLDEATDMNPAIVTAFPNLEKGVEFFQLWGIGNSNSMSDLHGSMATPKNGWDSVDPERDRVWSTTYDKGICIYHNPHDSPAITDPDPVKRAVLSKFLPTRESLEKDKLTRGENSESYWRFTMGFWIRKGVDKGIVSEQFLTEHQVYRFAEWTGFYPLIVVAGLDPAFEVGGTGCILRLAVLGHSTDHGRMCIDFRNEELLFRIEIDVTSRKSGELQLCEKVVAKLRQYNCPVSSLVIDATGAGRALGELLKIISGENEGPKKIVSNSRSLGMKQKKNDPEIIVATPSDMYFKFREFVQNYQVKGIDPVTLRQFSHRHVVIKNGKAQLETKAEYKMRMMAIDPVLAHSPDEADAAVLALHSAILMHGFHPGQILSSPPGSNMAEISQKMREILAMRQMSSRLAASGPIEAPYVRPALVPNFKSGIEDTVKKR